MSRYRIALASDVHANLPAFEAVLADVSRQNVDMFAFLGDIVGYGGSPVECLERMREACHPILLGNHDLMAACDFSLDGLRPDVRVPLEYSRQVLNTEQRTYLDNLPIAADFGEFELVHASLNEPDRFHYIHDINDAIDHLECQTHNVCFYGHTHLPVVWTLTRSGNIRVKRGYGKVLLHGGVQYIVGIGSVGQPRDCDPRACYVIYDTHERSVEFRRVEYDIRPTLRRIRAAGLPAFCGERLKAGL